MDLPSHCNTVGHSNRERRAAWLAIFAVPLAVSLLACGGESPTAPTSNSLQNLSGTWQGQWQITRCTGSRDCVFGIGGVFALSLRLGQTRARVGGVVRASSARPLGGPGIG